MKGRDYNYKAEQLQYESEKGKTQLQKSDPKHGVGSTPAESLFSMKRTFIQVVCKSSLCTKREPRPRSKDLSMFTPLVTFKSLWDKNMARYYNSANVRTVLLLTPIKVGMVFWQTAADSWECCRPNTSLTKSFTMWFSDNTWE